MPSPLIKEGEEPLAKRPRLEGVERSESDQLIKKTDREAEPEFMKKQQSVEATTTGDRVTDRETGFNRVKRSQVVVGTNAVSRHLERDALRAGLVCPSAYPPLMHQHLLMMAASRGVPFAAVPGLSKCAAPLLGLKTTLAIGFKVRISGDAYCHCTVILSEHLTSHTEINLIWQMNRSYL